MPNVAEPKRVLLVTGLSGAGKSTALNTLEDIGWEVIENIPLSLLSRLLATPAPAGSTEDRPIAIGLDSRTRGFDAQKIVGQTKALTEERGYQIETLFLECSGAELQRRYSETRRRHPLATDRPAMDGISAEREMMATLRRWADHVIDTTDTDTNGLRQQIRRRFGEAHAPTLSIQSFGFARGLPRNADLVFDMRFLQNPHWQVDLRPLTGLDEPVARHVAADPAYADAVGKIEDLLITLLPRYRAEGKSYVTVAFGCTGGRHRSVHVAQRVAARLRDAGFSPTVEHRDLALPSRDDVEGGSGRPTGETARAAIQGV